MSLLSNVIFMVAVLVAAVGVAWLVTDYMRWNDERERDRMARDLRKSQGNVRAANLRVIIGGGGHE